MRSACGLSNKPFLSCVGLPCSGRPLPSAQAAPGNLLTILLLPSPRLLLQAHCLLLKLPKATCMSRALARSGHEGGLQGKAVYPASEAAQASQPASQSGSQGSQQAHEQWGSGAACLPGLQSCWGIGFAANCHCLPLACSQFHVEAA